MSTSWGSYLARGSVRCSNLRATPNEKDDSEEEEEQAEMDPAVRSLVQRLESALRIMGLTKFSSSVAVQFLAVIQFCWAHRCSLT